MGNSCGCSPSQLELNAKEILRYKGSISANLKKYSFDSTNAKEFLNKVIKENNINESTAQIWINLYIDYMICLGFNYDKSPSKAVKQQQAESIDRNLSFPYEILQVWRIHVLYTKKYEEFCLLVSNSGNKFIPFVPPKQIWKKADPKTLNAYFRFNHDLMAKAFTKNKKDIDSLFVFQSSYLKNTLHFCLCESISPNMVGNVVAAYNN